MKSLLSAGTFSPIAVLKIYLPKGQVVRAFAVVRPKIYLSRAIGRVGISSPAHTHTHTTTTIKHTKHVHSTQLSASIFCTCIHTPSPLSDTNTHTYNYIYTCLFLTWSHIMLVRGVLRVMSSVSTSAPTDSSSSTPFTFLATAALWQWEKMTSHYFYFSTSIYFCSGSLTL